MKHLAIETGKDSWNLYGSTRRVPIQGYYDMNNKRGGVHVGRDQPSRLKHPSNNIQDGGKRETEKQEKSKTLNTLHNFSQMKCNLRRGPPDFASW